MRARYLQLVSLLLAAGLLAASARVSYLAHDQFTNHELRLGGKFSAATPPSMVLMTTALGTFRGLFIDYLWHRATQLQDDGQFFEANTLAQAITTLMPAAPAVWQFQAWNMAYNISVATHTPEERWEWVRRGIDLLRDRGIPANPQAIALYRELSWIFLHKIGGRSDDMHWYYRIQLARQWQELLGYVPSQQTTVQTIDSMRAIAHSPPSLDALRASTPTLGVVLARLASIGYAPDPALVSATGRALMLRSSLQAQIAATQTSSDYDPRLLDLLADPQLGPAFSALLNTLRRQIILNQYHMDPAFMLALMADESEGGKGYGPIDWRLSSAHALYWSQLGSDRFPPVTTMDEIDLLNDRRQVIHALQDMAHFGRIRFDPASNSYHLMPDVRFFPAYDKAYERMKAFLTDTPDNRGAIGVYDQGHENLLLDAAQTEYFYGDRDRAQQYFQKAKRLYADAWWNGGPGRSTKYALNLDDFLTLELRDQVKNRSMQAASALIEGMLYQAFLDGLAGAQPAAFDRFVSVARIVHGDFQKRAADAPTPLAPQQRMQFLPFDAVVQQSFTDFMTDNSLDLVARATAWRAAPESLRRAVYAAAGPTLQQQAQAAGYDPAKTFAPPAGVTSQLETRNSKPETPPSPSDLIERH